MKKTTKTKKIEKTAKAREVKKERYFEAVGRRKTAVARVRVFPAGRKEILVNERPLEQYFPLKKQQETVRAPFDEAALRSFRATVKVKGSGLQAQTEAVRLGISRALILLNPLLRSRFKALGYLTRDSRMVERKKAGLRKARRPQQWRKR